MKAAVPALPPTPGRPVDVYHGVSVTDDYRYLEDRTDPEVRACSDAQNAVARARLDGLPSGAILCERTCGLIGMSVRPRRWPGTVAASSRAPTDDGHGRPRDGLALDETVALRADQFAFLLAEFGFEG